MSAPRLLNTLVVCTLLTVGVFNQPLDADELPIVRSQSKIQQTSFQLSTSDSIRLFEYRVQQNPTDYISRTQLGQLHLRHARETGSLASYQNAEQTFVKALDVNPKHIAARSQLAQAYTAQHRFSQALDIAQQLFDDDFSNLTALAIMGDAYLELGQYKLAERSFQLLYQEVQTAPAISRLAHFAELKGDNAKALKLMQRAHEMAVEDGISKTELAWYAWRIGDLHYHSGQLQQAKRLYQASFDLNPKYHIALNGLADVAAASGNPTEAAKYWQASLKLRPSPATHAELASIFDELGDKQQSARHLAEAERLTKLPGINKFVYTRTLAELYCDQDRELDTALKLAQNELKQRKDIEGYDVLAWTLYKLKRYQEAGKAMQQAMRMGIKEPGFYFHAAMIEHKLGNNKQAIAYLREIKNIADYLLPEEGHALLKQLEQSAS